MMFTGISRGRTGDQHLSGGLGPPARRIVSWCWAATAFTAPMNGLRLSKYMSLGDVLLVVAVAATLVARGPAPDGIAARPYGPVLAGLAAIALGGLVGSLVAGPYGPDIPGVARFVFTTAGSIAALILWAPSGRRLRWFCATWVAGAVVSALWAITFSTTVASRPLGLASHPNNLGLTCLLAAGPALGLVLAPSRVRRRGALVAVGILLLGLAASGSRAAVIGACVMVPTVAALSSNLRLALRATIAAVLLSLAVVVGVVHPSTDTGLGRVMGDRSTIESDAGRMEHLARSVDRVRSNPLTGEGFTRAGDAHNIYLQVLVAAGPLGLIGLVVAAGSILTAGLGRLRLRLPGDDRALLAGLTAGYAGYLVASGFQNNLSQRYLWLYVAALVSLAASHARPAGPTLATLEDQPC